MIPPDQAADLQSERRFDVAAAILIGTVAVLAALLAVIEVGSGQAATRAQLEAARLTADLSAGLQASSMVEQAIGSQQQEAAGLAFEGSSRMVQAVERGDEAQRQIGQAEVTAADALAAALAASAATAADPPLDAYTARLVEATIDDLTAEVGEQNHQVDLADEADGANTKAILGLSFLALAGVLTGLGAVLGEGRAGWFALLVAVGMTTTAGAMAILAIV